jgi:hypothetical protein
LNLTNRDRLSTQPRSRLLASLISGEAVVDALQVVAPASIVVVFCVRFLLVSRRDGRRVSNGFSSYHLRRRGGVVSSRRLTGYGGGRRHVHGGASDYSGRWISSRSLPSYAGCRRNGHSGRRHYHRRRVGCGSLADRCALRRQVHRRAGNGRGARGLRDRGGRLLRCTARAYQADSEDQRSKQWEKETSVHSFQGPILPTVISNGSKEQSAYH